MQDADLFIGLAGIAGVFVGFGALIAVRSGGTGEPQEVSATRAIVVSGLLTVVAALVPVTLGRYGLTERQVWALSSVAVLFGIVAAIVAQVKTPEYKAMVEAARARKTGAGEVVQMVLWVIVFGGATLALAIVTLGPLPDLDAALYFTALVLLLLNATWVLLWLVYLQRSVAGA